MDLQEKIVNKLIIKANRLLLESKQGLLLSLDLTEQESQNSQALAKLVQDIEKKIRLFDIAYYEQSISLVSDSKYDELCRVLDNLLQVFPHLKKNSVRNQVGSLTYLPFMQIPHNSPMLSLHNAFMYSELLHWYNSIQKILNNSQIVLSTEPKVDGVSINLQYQLGKLKLALTRGDGKIGEDVLQNVKYISDIPQFLDLFYNNIFKNSDVLEIRGEIYITKENFLNLLELEIDGIVNSYSTPRNAASGILRQKIPNPKLLSRLNFFAYGIGGYDFNGNNFITHYELMKFLAKLKLPIVPQLGLCDDLMQVTNIYQNMIEQRMTLSYDIDGIVLKVNQLSYQKELGMDSRSPRWAIAYKFPAQHAITKIKEIIVQVGRSGLLVPVAILDSINIGGSFINRVTLHNENFILNKDIQVGDIVEISKAGDIIPQVTKVFHNKRTTTQKWQPPTVCPFCQTTTIKTNIYRYCPAHKTCPEQIIANLKNFISKGALDIQGFGDGTIRKFFKQKLLVNFHDFFELKHKITDLKELEHYSKLLQMVEDRKYTTLPALIYGLGIPDVGKNIAYLISEAYKHDAKQWFNDMQSQNLELIAQAHGIGPVILNSLSKYFLDQDNIKEVSKLLNLLQIQISQDQKHLPLNGEVIVFSGTLKNMNRIESITCARKLGARVVNQVSKNVTLLVVGKNPNVKKIQMSELLGIKIISESDWNNYLNNA